MPEKKIYLIHGWGGNPDGGFRSWLKKELEARGYFVESLAMPDTDNPTIEKWIPYMEQAIKNPDENTILVGHSLGGQAILRYLEGVPNGVRIGKGILVGGVIDAIDNLEGNEISIARPWLETPIDAEKVKRSAKELVAFFSDNDPWIPLESERVARETYGIRTIVEHGMGHYNEESGLKEFPQLLEAILN